MSAQLELNHSGRFCHVLDHHHHHHDGIGRVSSQTSTGDPHQRDLLQILIDENQDVWVPLLENAFCIAMKEAPSDDQAVLRGFEYYMRQDYRYVSNLIEVQSSRVPTAKTAEGFASVMRSVSNAVKYTQDAFATLTAASPHGMGVDASSLLATKVSEAMEEYIKLVTAIAQDENPVIAKMALIGLQSYYRIAADLYLYSDHQDTTWYKFWTEANFIWGKVCLTQQLYFINNDWQKDKQRLTELFRDICQAELALWDDALDNSRSTVPL